MSFTSKQLSNILDTLVTNASRALQPKSYDEEIVQAEDKEKIGDFTESISTPELLSCNSSLKSEISEKEIKRVISTAPLELPFVPSTPALYKPSPYTFRIPGNLFVTNGSNLAKCPPFHIQLDHALAVIWSLFSNFEAKKPLGVAQIQWALSFLRGIQDQSGQNPKDVAVCIDTMEEALIQKYAEMANTVKSPRTPKTAFKKPEIIKIPEILPPPPTTSKTSTSGITQNKLDSRIVIQKMPFSVNYADMAKRKPIPEHLDIKKEIASIEGSQKSDKIDDAVSSSTAKSSISNMGEGYSRDTIINFLKAWRKEQVNKIQEELKRLHLIEEFISNVDQENFTPYLDTTQLDVLVAQKLKNYKVDDLISPSSLGSAKKPQTKAKLV